jgi:very-short-patch-repair endonuclease
MRRVFNPIETKNVRQYLRRNTTPAEKRLWSKLRRSNLNGLKFRRQCGIGKYVFDFYCPKFKLAIEVDGDVHGKATQIIKDMEKERHATQLGVTVLRFTNGEILESMDGVLEKILSTTPSTPDLAKEGGQ